MTDVIGGDLNIYCSFPSSNERPCNNPSIVLTSAALAPKSGLFSECVNPSTILVSSFSREFK